MPNPGRRIFMTAAEVSGDLHASHLVRSLLAIDPSLRIEGHGGPRMRDAGAAIHVETTAKAAMGLSGVGRVREMYRLLRWTRDCYRADPPDLHVCVDSSAVNLHFARIARTANPERPVPVLYYIAPQLWAWREGRMKRLRKWANRLACILPFEEPYFRSHGVNATFVGHPLFDEVREKREARSGRREGAADSPVVGLLTGSRAGEARANFGRMLDVAEQIRREFPAARFLAPTTAATNPIVTREAARHALSSSITVREGAFDDFVPECDLVLTVSGTATLHVAIHGTPMIVVYYGNPVLWNAVGRWLMRTRTYALVNLLAADPQLAAGGRVTSDMHIVPEFIPWYGSTDPVANHAIDLLRHPDKLDAQRQRLAALTSKLDKPGASMRTAQIAMEMLEKRHQNPTPVPVEPDSRGTREATS
jgi:lipid-A-disaccharide synthase